MGGNHVIARSNQITVRGNHSVKVIQELLSRWKFVYTYKFTGETDYSTREVNVNANVWSNHI